MRRAALALLFAPVAWLLSRAPLRGDDIGFAMWSMTTPFADAPSGPPWHTYVRPLEYVSWWMAGRADLGMESMRLLLQLAWLGTLAVLAHRAKDTTTALAALVMVGLAPVYQDLLTWRSFFSRAVVLLLIAAVPRRPVPYAGVGLLALGFKEPGALAVGLAGLVRGPRWSAAGLIGLVGLVAIPSLGKVGATFHGVEYLRTLEDFAFAAPILVATRWSHPGLLVGVAVLSQVPWVGAIGLLVALVLALTPAEAGAVGVAWLVVLPGVVTSRQYLLEGWVLAATFLGTRSVRPLAIVLSALAAIPSNVAYFHGREGLAAGYYEQADFLRGFHPPPARIVYYPYFPAPGWDLDALVWVREGAEFGGTPPPGTEPDHVGPRSGVWALE